VVEWMDETGDESILIMNMISPLVNFMAVTSRTSFAQWETRQGTARRAEPAGAVQPDSSGLLADADQPNSPARQTLGDISLPHGIRELRSPLSD